MLLQLLYILLAILGIGFLIFIHELAHYLMARRVGMTVEVFSIGFGRPLYSWMRGTVRWQIALLPFGGYVKIRGMHEEKKGVDPHTIPDGFFGKSPAARVKVALAGPVVNLVFALFAFSLLFLLGGREKPFAEFTHKIGALDPTSALFKQGVRPGDEIARLDGAPFKGVRELHYLALSRKGSVQMEGDKIDYYAASRSPFSYELVPYKQKANPDFSTVGVQAPASFLIYAPSDPSILEISSLNGSGIAPGDQIVFVDGELIFSPLHLISVLNGEFVFLTVERGGERFQTRVPRIKMEALSLSDRERAEIDDWRRELKIEAPLASLSFLPYDLDAQGKVERQLHFIDPKEEKRVLSPCHRCSYFTPLQPGDRIVAVAGTSVTSAYEILAALQERRAVIIVKSPDAASPLPLRKEVDRFFDARLEIRALEEIVSLVGSSEEPLSQGGYTLLRPVTLKTLSEIQLASSQADLWKHALKKEEERISKLKDPEMRRERLADLEREKGRFALGVPLRDATVLYNPDPLLLFNDTLLDIKRTLVSIASGLMSPKYLAGPLGMIQLVQSSWNLGIKEALFWLGMISLNLGVLNLLPLPVLDGGHTLFALIERITGRRIRIKTMEKLILPFAALLILFILYVTFHDLLRLFSL